MYKIIEGRDCEENDVYFALSLVTGYPVRKFDSYVDCINYCRENENDVYPATNNFEVIVEW